MPFAPLIFACSLVSDIYRDSFCRLFTEHRTSLETSSLPATSVHQDDTLTYAVFVLETLNYYYFFFFATGLCQPGSQQLCISKLFLKYIFSTLYLCLGYQFRAHSVFYTTYFVYFSMPYSLISHHSYIFCAYSGMYYTESSVKEYIVAIRNLPAKLKTLY